MSADKSTTEGFITEMKDRLRAYELRQLPKASQGGRGTVRLATDTETQTGTDDSIAVTPEGLSSRTATETRTGIAEIATQAETNAGTDDSRFITAKKLAMRPLQGQVPSSVTVGSGSASVSADGWVLFSGASTITINGVFDGLGIDFYEIHWRLAVTSASYLQFQIAVAGVPVSSSTYFRNLLFVPWGGTPAVTADNQVALILGSSATSVQDGSLLLRHPARAAATTYQASYQTAAAATAIVGGYTGVGTACDGFRFSNSGAGAMTGELKVLKL